MTILTVNTNTWPSLHHYACNVWMIDEAHLHAHTFTNVILCELCCLHMKAMLYKIWHSGYTHYPMVLNAEKSEYKNSTFRLTAFGIPAFAQPTVSKQ